MLLDSSSAYALDKMVEPKYRLNYFTASFEWLNRYVHADEEERGLQSSDFQSYGCCIVISIKHTLKFLQASTNMDDIISVLQVSHPGTSKSQFSTSLVSAPGLGLIFDVPSENARLPSLYSGSVPCQNPAVHWSGKGLRHHSSSQSTDSQSESDPECSEATALRESSFSEAGKHSDSYVVHLPCFSPEITEAIKAYRLCLPPSSVLVAYVDHPRTAVIFLSDTEASSHMLQKRVLVACLEALEADGVAQVYVAVRKAPNEVGTCAASALLKTLMFLGFEMFNPGSVSPELACLTIDYRLLFTNLRE
ncbi:hypothetical protein CSKR_109143 [Clonorchis sinensis]|uniref:Fibrillin 2 n=1 Tax=Clonorchis sinensis TaxID=79923 RepID=A0A3R7FN72_CLOSI|nr:hypothetical protein CSKR_109143 [Clonorchis sinensis]